MPEIIEQTFGEDIFDGHLGGCFFGGDKSTYYPKMWEHLITEFGITSVLDIGCGRGFASKFFLSMGCDVASVDGSEKVREVSLVPDNFILNDYEKGSAIQDEKFELAWSCEFVEHVYEQYIPNFMSDFKRCKYVAMTFAYPGQGGHHHVNENTQEYWVDKFEQNGFRFDEVTTNVLRSMAGVEGPYVSHFGQRGLFFINNNW